MKMVLNVSREEYWHIQELAAYCSRYLNHFDEATWVAEMRFHYGCEPYNEYRIKVLPYTPDQLTLERTSGDPT